MTGTFFCEGEDEPCLGDCDIWQRVLLDIYHFMDRIGTSVRHGANYEFMRAVRDAIFLYDADDFAKVDAYLKDLGIAISDFLEQRSDLACKLIRRLIVASRELKSRLESVFSFYRNRKDNRTGLPLFNEKVEANIKRFMKHVENGCLSDHPDVVIYRKAGIHAQSGLTLWRNSRNSSSVEGAIHRQLLELFTCSGAGVDLGDLVLCEWRMRYNVQADARSDGNGVFCGHFELAVVDDVVALEEKLYGRRRRHVEWVSPADLKLPKQRHGIQSYTADQLGDLSSDGTSGSEPAKAFNLGLSSTEISRLKVASKKALPPAQLYLSVSQGAPLPVRPVFTKEEKALFLTIANEHAVDRGAKDDWDMLANRFNAVVAKRMLSNVGPKNCVFKLAGHIQMHSGSSSRAANSRQTMRAFKQDNVSFRESLRSSRAIPSGMSRNDGPHAKASGKSGGSRAAAAPPSKRRRSNNEGLASTTEPSTPISNPPPAGVPPPIVAVELAAPEFASQSEGLQQNLNVQRDVDEAPVPVSSGIPLPQTLLAQHVREAASTAATPHALDLRLPMAAPWPTQPCWPPAFGQFYGPPSGPQACLLQPFPTLPLTTVSQTPLPSMSPTVGSRGLLPLAVRSTDPSRAGHEHAQTGAGSTARVRRCKGCGKTSKCPGLSRGISACLGNAATRSEEHDG